MATLRLGIVDRDAAPSDLAAYLRAYHEPGMQAQFRGEKNAQWSPASPADGEPVRSLQRALRAFGFLPHGEIDGIFGYRTQSAVRLFQEYVRTVEGRAEIGAADALAGPKTLAHVERWRQAGLTADWTGVSPAAPRPGFRSWLRFLVKLRDHLRQTNDPVQGMIARMHDTSGSRPDSLPLDAWDLSPDRPHLIGIRRGADADWKVRINNDVFVLLVDGMKFVFFGSTDPTPRGNRTARPPFLVPGQHRYRFGWHKLSDPVKVYRGFRPAGRGVLVIRDAPGSVPDALDPIDVAHGIERTPNTTINIHWSGRHTSSWSAGCQVVAGGGYINHNDEVVDCWPLAAPRYGDLPGMTRGAYNVLLDLVTVFTPKPLVRDGDDLRYTLVDESDLALATALGPDAARTLLRRGLGILEHHWPEKHREYVELLG